MIYFFLPVDVMLRLAPTSPSLSAHLYKRSTLLPDSIEMDLARSHVMNDPYLPSAPVSPQTLDRVGCMSVPSASHPLPNPRFASPRIIPTSPSRGVGMRCGKLH